MPSIQSLKRREPAIYAQAVVAPEELRPFAHHVKKFNSELRDHLTSLVNQLAVLETTWRDQAQNKFVEQFEERSDFERFRP